MLVGLKINENVLSALAKKMDKSDFDMLHIIAGWFHVHHQGVFVIGRDSKLCEQPHFHIHFYTDAGENAVKTLKSKKVKELQDKGFDTGGRTTKMYIPKEIQGANPIVFMAYATKEAIVWVHSTFETQEFETERQVQFKLKQQKYVRHQVLEKQTEEKKEFKEEMFEYVIKNLPIDANPHDYDLYYELMIEYLISKNKYGSIKMCFLKTWFMEFSVKHLGKNAKDILKLIR